MPQGILEADAIAVGAAAVGLNTVRAGECGGPEEAAAEARALLVGPVHQANGDGRLAVEVLSQRAQHFECGENAQCAIEPAAVGYGVKMAAQDEGLV